MAFGALGIHNNLGRVRNTQLDSIRKISSGLKINSAKDDASGYQIYHSMSAKLLAQAQSSQNIQTGNALLSTADGAVSSTVAGLRSLKENLINAANGTNSPSDIAALQKRVDQTIKGIDDNAHTTFNGQYLTDGSMQNLTLAGDHGSYNMSIGDMTARGLGLADDEGNSTLDLSSQEGIGKAIETVDAALQTALSEQGNIGAMQQGLTYANDNYITAAYNTTEAMSTIGDLDMAKESMRLKSSNTLEQANYFMMSQMFKSNANVLALLH